VVDTFLLSARHKVNEVRASTMRPGRERCECVGFTHHKHCSHVEAARIAKKRSAICDSCGKRHWRSDLTEVHEEDGLLSWFAGDRLCRGCIGEGAWA
jgi:hypothetical protein